MYHGNTSDRNAGGCIRPVRFKPDSESFRSKRLVFLPDTLCVRMVRQSSTVAWWCWV